MQGTRAGRLQDRVAIVTGGGAGIGEACCRLFAEEGAKVVVAEVNEATGRAVAQAINDSGGQAHFVHCDVGVEADVEAAVNAAVATYGAIDILVNNAGIVLVKDALHTSTGEWTRVLEVNLRGAWLFSKHALPALLDKGRGAIVNIASIHAVQTLNELTAYASSKGGMLAMTRSMAIDYAPGVRVNAILPGYIQTNMWGKVLETTDDPEKLTAETIALQPMGRLGDPVDVARAALFLASDESSFITGTSLIIDGGLSARFHN